MATKREHDHQAQKSPAGTPAADHGHYDELTGVYGFFRRYQKLLLYTAGLFTLLTFSITGPMRALVSTVFGTTPAAGSIVVGGKRVNLSAEDYQVGNMLSRHQGDLRTLLSEPERLPLPPGVMIPIPVEDGGDTDLTESFAILRRAAIDENIGVSLLEVDKAIEAARELAKAESVAKLARAKGFGSPAEYRETVAEAMRVGLYMRLQMLALDNGDAEIMRRAIGDREKITLRVASWDEKAHQDELKAATALAEADLRAWIDGKDNREQKRIGVFDLPRAQLRFAALLLADGQFDPAQWQDDYLKDFAVSDDQLKSYYDQDKDLRFKIDGGNEFKPFEDEAVKAELTRLAQAERVMNELLGKLRQRQAEALKPLTEALEREQAALNDARSVEQELQGAESSKQMEFKAAEQAVADHPDDPDAKTKLETLRAELQRAKDAAFQAAAVVPAMQAAVDAAQKALDDARAAWDFPAAVAELTAGKSGFVVKAMSEQRAADGIKDLDALGLELGQWPLASQGTSVQNPGDLGYGPGRTSKAIVLYQATALEREPWKPWETLKPLLEDAYWAEKAKADGIEKKKAMESALLTRAKELMPEFLAAREAERQSRIDAKIGEWEEGVKKVIAEAQEMLQRPNLGTRARTDWQRKLTTKEAELAQKEQRSEQMKTSVDREIENEVKQEAKKHYAKVIDAAAAEAGFTVGDLDPHPRDLQQLPRFDARYDPTVVFLWRNQSQLKVDEATDVLQDTTARRYLVAICIKVEPLTADDITRREFEALRVGLGMPFARLQVLSSMGQAFSREALEARYQFQKAVGTQTDLAPAAQ